MKKITLGLIAMAGLLFTSCDMETKDSTATVGYGAYNLMVPLDGGEATAVPCAYIFNFNLTQSKVKLEGTYNYNSGKYEFETDEVSYTQYPPYDGMVYYMTGFKGNVNGQPSMALADTKLLLTSNFNWPYYTDFKLDNFYPNKEGLASGGDPLPGVWYLPNNWPQPVVLASYQIGQDYRVKTFSSDCTYVGTTTTSYPVHGQDQSFETKTIYYRIVLDIDKKKACAVLYRAKFSNVEAEPEKRVIYLADLDLTLGDGYYTVTGNDIIPQTIEGNKLEDNPSFKFKSFRMSTVGNYMESAQISYEVINSMGAMEIPYSGRFTGTTVNIPSLN